ncbi:MAG: glycosyltransferase [Eubacteriales bacterium]
MKSVLFFSVSIGAGHDLAAQAVAQEIIHRYEHCQTKIVDTFRYINPVLNRVIVGSYMESLKFNPKIWGYLYKQAEQGDKFVDLSSIISKIGSTKTENLINELDPQVVVCTHAFPTGILSAMKAKGKLKVPLVVILTDYTVHPFWIHEHVDKYVLPCAELKYEIMEYGVPEEKIMPTGIPLRRQFIDRLNKAEARHNLGLDDKTTVLAMGGGLGLGEIENIIKTLGNADMDLQIVTVTGKNDRLRTKLQLASMKNKVKVFGFIDNISEVMAASDFIVTKPGGLTTAEVLAEGLPMIIVDPLPGQEDRNSEFLLNNGVAVKVRSIRHLIPQIKYLVTNETRLKQIREMASVIGKPRAAVELVDYLETAKETRLAEKAGFR